MPQLIEVPGYGTVEFPDGMSDDQIAHAIRANMQPRSAPTPHVGSGVIDDIRNAAGGFARSGMGIVSNLLRPIDYLTGDSNDARMERVNQRFQNQGYDQDSTAFKGGKLAGDVALTAPVGGVLAKGVTAAGKAIPAAAPYVERLAQALQTGGFKLGGTPATTTAGKVANALTRVGAGATVGGASAGLINPDEAGTGAVLGGVMPVAVQAAGKLGNALTGSVSPEVSALYQKAKDLGIDIPADRLTNSKPLNAVAASLNYVPLSGRMATEDKMLSQFNRAISRTFGQDSDNVTMALRKAGKELGQKFDDTLQAHSVKIDNQFLDDLASASDQAGRELSAPDAKLINNQIDEILNKGASGQIDGQAAYNIKKTLDRIGNRNSNEAYYARDLKKKLIAALNRSMPPEEAANFATLRQQYGNMLDMEGLAQNGAEGGVSVARVANMKHINNPDMQDLADVAAQFIKTREAPHGAAQRVMMGTLGAGGLAGGAATGTLPLIASGMAAGRALNTALNSKAWKSAITNREALARALLDSSSNPMLRSLPVAISAGRAGQQ